VSSLVHSWKSFTAHQANRLLTREGAFWQADYFDRFIRDEEHYRRVIEYIENNPVKAGLCARPEDWTYGSARRRR
jgi:putative DNA methylase